MDSREGADSGLNDTRDFDSFNDHDLQLKFNDLLTTFKEVDCDSDDVGNFLYLCG